MYTYGCSMGFNLVSLYGFASDSCDSSSLFLAQRPWGLQKTPKQTEQRATPRRATLCRGGAPRPRRVTERCSARRPWHEKTDPLAALHSATLRRFLCRPPRDARERRSARRRARARSGAATERRSAARNGRGGHSTPRTRLPLGTLCQCPGVCRGSFPRFSP